MSCSCNNSYYNLPCCCPTTPATTTTTTICVGGTVCDEVYTSDCVTYNGFDLACYGILKGSNLTTIVQTLIGLLPACPSNFVANVSSTLTSASIVSFSPTLYTTPVTGSLPVAAGATLTAILTTPLSNASLTTYVTTGTAAAKLVLIKNNVIIKTTNISANQTNFAVVNTLLTWAITDKVTIQLIAQ
jgi:hypothetical protein